jgi:hypothetical protein
VKHIVSQRAYVSILCVCIWAVLCSLGQFTSTAAAQTNTPTPAPSPTPTSTSTPTTAPTSTAAPTPAGRIVNFTVDDNDITEGECVLLSWVVKGSSEADTFVVEFDNKEDDFQSTLVAAEVYDRQECLDNDANYVLTVTWSVGPQTTKKIHVEVDPRSSDSGGGGGQPATPAAPGTFVAVTPISAAVITPAGPLGSVQVLPETGAAPQPGSDSHQSLVGGLAVTLGMALISLAFVLKTTREKEAPDES